MGFSISSSAALEDSAVVKAAGGTLYRLNIINTEAAVRYIMLFDATSLPANATAPLYRFTVASSGSLDIDLSSLRLGNEGSTGLSFSTGIVVANSTTAATLTVSTGDDVLIDAIYS